VGHAPPQSILRNRNRIVQVHRARRFHATLFRQNYFRRHVANRRCDRRDGHGAEGLDVRAGRDILLADDPLEFAEHVVRFLRDEETRRKYEAAAAATVQKYDWSSITERFVEALHRTIGAGSHASAPSEQIVAV